MSKRPLTSLSITALAAALSMTSGARAADVVLHKTPAVTEQAPKLSGPNHTVGYIRAEVAKAPVLSRTLYVSSSADMKTAGNMIDKEPSTTFAFGTNDAAPTTIFDVGKVTTLHRISASYTSRGGKVDFYVLSTLPGSGAGIPTNAENAPMSFKMDDSELRSVGSVTDDGNGRASVNFPATTGRYVMVKWTPAQLADNLIVAEVAAFGGSDENDAVASNKSRKSSAVEESDGKTMIDAKDMGEGGKDMPGEGPQDTPAEGPASSLPQPPPFVFIPELLPVSK